MASASKKRKAKLKKGSARYNLTVNSNSSERDVLYPIKWTWKQKRRCFYTSSLRQKLKSFDFS